MLLFLFITMGTAYSLNDVSILWMKRQNVVLHPGAARWQHQMQSRPYLHVYLQPGSFLCRIHFVRNKLKK